MKRYPLCVDGRGIKQKKSNGEEESERENEIKEHIDFSPRG